MSQFTSDFSEIHFNIIHPPPYKWSGYK